MATQSVNAPSIIRPTMFAPIDVEAERKKIFDQLGEDFAKPLARLCFGNRLLVVKFVPEKQGSLHVAPKTQQEAKWQGKVGLVVYKGAAAFQDDPQAGSFYGDAAEVGDWVWYRYSDGLDVDYVPAGTFQKISLRCLIDTEVCGVVPRPDFFF